MTFLVGNDPYDAKVESFSGNGSTTVFTLANSTITNALVCRINGVTQKNNTDFIVSNTTLTFTTAPSSGTDIVVQYFGVGTFQIPADASVTEAKLGTNAVTNAKVADDAIGVAELSATNTPSSSTFLRGDNSWAEAGGGWEFVSTATASSSSSIEFTGLESGYDYQIVLTEWITSAASYVRLRMGVTGPTYRTSGYLSSGYTLHSTSSAAVAGRTETTFIVLQQYNQTAGNPFSWTIDILNPVGSGKSQVRAFSGGLGAGVDREINFGEGLYNTAESHTAVQLYPTSGTFTSGTALIYRRSRS